MAVDYAPLTAKQSAGIMQEAIAASARWTVHKTNSLPPVGMNAITELHGSGVRESEPLTRSGPGGPEPWRLKMILLEDAILVWTPNSDYCRAEVRGFKRTDGDRWMPAKALGEWGEHTHKCLETQLLAMFILFNTIVVRDGVSVEAAHKAFLQIEEYKRMISRDTPGAA